MIRFASKVRDWPPSVPSDSHYFWIDYFLAAMARDTIVGGFVVVSDKMLRDRIKRQLNFLMSVLHPRVPQATADALDSEVGSVLCRSRLFLSGVICFIRVFSSVLEVLCRGRARAAAAVFVCRLSGSSCRTGPSK